MSLKKIGNIAILSSAVLLIFITIYFKYIRQNELAEPEIEASNELIYNSNIIENVNYTSVDSDGNKYTINILLQLWRVKLIILIQTFYT